MYSETSTPELRSDLPVFHGRGTQRLHTDSLLIDEILTDAAVDDFLRELEMQWEVQTLHWVRQDGVELYPEALDLTLRAAYHWAGIPYSTRGFPFRVARYRRILRERSASRWNWLKGVWSRWQEERKLRRFFARTQAQPPRGGHTPAVKLALLIGLDGRYIDPSRLAPVMMDFLKSLAEVSVFVPFAAQTMRVDDEFRHDVHWDVGTGHPRQDIISGSMNLAVKYLTDRLVYDVAVSRVATEKVVLKNVERRIFSVGHR